MQSARSLKSYNIAFNNAVVGVATRTGMDTPGVMITCGPSAAAGAPITATLTVDTFLNDGTASMYSVARALLLHAAWDVRWSGSTTSESSTSTSDNVNSRDSTSSTYGVGPARTASAQAPTRRARI